MHELRCAVPADLEACLTVWVAACAARDGQAFDGVAERARPKFGAGVVWLVADGVDGADGFVLATRPGSGLPADPADAPVLGLLAAGPGAQARGLGRALLREATARLALLGYQRAVLHALLDNVAAVGLYESEGWVAAGDPFEHSLLKRPTQRFDRLL
ncbi:GNAT family N-acetyltransferase [Frigoribacterium sp. CFBP 8751]|uniref:GNAT family N-acetyltransferase n=1 Tax=Frigoribacterium sp. CFBP 8751 TaxID=2775277 RepID=UPI00177DBD3D|nr:GNAT family N-acetyltransferase [Frigoribacterium sp. CFBP 8751]